MGCVAAVKEFSKRKGADGLVVPCWQGKTRAEWAAREKGVKAPVEAPVTLGDFKGKAGEISVVYLDGLPEARVILVGLGERDKATPEVIQKGYSTVVKQCRKLKMKSLNVLLPHIAPGDEGLKGETVMRAAADGMLLTNYAFDVLKKKSIEKEPTVLLQSINFVGVTPKMADIADRSEVVMEGVNLARNLINANADDVTPQFLGGVAKQMAKDFPTIKATVFDRKRMEKEGMGLLLAVSRGSVVEPALIIVEYRGNEGSEDHTVFVGKGITYDTGGLNLKPTGSMETMRTDMSGGAAVLGAVHAAARLGLKVNVTGVIASTENSIGSAAYKPGDVYVGYSGKSVEIGNTDAEGRLVLADALSYVDKNLKATRMVDLATLTGAAVIAVGEEIGALMSDDGDLTKRLEKASKATGEVVWPLPLYKPYKEHLKSHLADIKNCSGRAGSSITAGLFLQEFTGQTPWAHLDIAGPAFPDKQWGCHDKGATGYGVRLLVEMLEGLA